MESTSITLFMIFDGHQRFCALSSPQAELQIQIWVPKRLANEESLPVRKSAILRSSPSVRGSCGEAHRHSGSNCVSGRSSAGFGWVTSGWSWIWGNCTKPCKGALAHCASFWRQDVSGTNDSADAVRLQSHRGHSAIPRVAGSSTSDDCSRFASDSDPALSIISSKDFTRAESSLSSEADGLLPDMLASSSDLFAEPANESDSRTRIASFSDFHWGGTGLMSTVLVDRPADQISVWLMIDFVDGCENKWLWSPQVACFWKDAWCSRLQNEISDLCTY